MKPQLCVCVCVPTFAVCGDSIFDCSEALGGGGGALWCFESADHSRSFQHRDK